MALKNLIGKEVSQYVIFNAKSKKFPCEDREQNTAPSDKKS